MKRAILIGLALAAPLSALAAGDSTIKVTVTGSAVGNLIESEIGKQFKPDSKFHWWPDSQDKVVLSPTDQDWVSHVVLDLQAVEGTTTNRVFLNFDLVYDCDYDGVHVTMDNVDPDVVGVGHVTDARLAKITADSNALLAKKLSAINDGLWKKLEGLALEPGGFDLVCPRFTVSDDGGVVGLMDPDHGCVGHTIRTTTGCPAKWVGHGVQQICVNSQWKSYAGSTCHWEVPTDPSDPKAPPGGHQP